ncbi:hypothetical protein DL95DRAFT_385960 [Leptodontidium sp. 2 PMI_412]|nr:hypothetical protein DL95DRAFT_385960 [Leptodontidium sp. 2 PMI_412]
MACLGTFTVASITSIWLLLGVVAAQHYPRNTALNGTTAKPNPTPTSSSSELVTSSFSDIKGPFLAAVSSTWTQVIIPTTVGTVMVVVNEATNETSSTTIYHTDYERNGSSTILTRTDTDAAGTVTQVVTDKRNSQLMTIAYPTNYFVVEESLTWDAILPTVHINSTCCFETPTLSATPTHTPFVQVGPLDDADSRGWLYSLVGVNYGEAYTVLDSTEVSSLWSGQTLGIEYDGCPYTYCQLAVTSVSPASAVQAQPGAILATSTRTISIPPAGGSSSPKAGTGSSPTTFTPLPDQVSSPIEQNTPSPGPPETTPRDNAPSPGPSPEPTRPASTQVSGAPPQINTGNPQASNPSPQSGVGTSISAPEPGSMVTPRPIPTSTADSLVITIGSSVISANSASQFIIGDQTLGLGSTITIGSGSSTTVVALQTTGSNTVLVVGDSSSTLNNAAPVATIGGSVVTADSASNYIIGGQTLAPGSEIVVGGTTISLASGGTQLIEGTKTMVQSTGIGGIIWSVFGGTTATSVGETGAASPTYVQASIAGRLSPPLVMFLSCFLSIVFIMRII